MSKPFKFMKPIIRLNEQLLDSIGYRDIYGVRFLKESPPETKRSTRLNKDTRKWEPLTSQLKETRETKQVITEHQKEQFRKFNKEVSSLKGVVIGAVHCPITNIKLRDILFNEIIHDKGKSFLYLDEFGVKVDSLYGRYIEINPNRIKIDNELEDWYSEPVLSVMAAEWSYKEKSPDLRSKPDLTIVEDNLFNLEVWYSDNGYQSLENKKVYLSVNGRYFKNRGKKNFYIPSLAIDDLKEKVKKELNK